MKLTDRLSSILFVPICICFAVIYPTGKAFSQSKVKPKAVPNASVATSKQQPAIQAQKTTAGSSIPEVVQSPYYDAIELVYVLKGCKAYPVLTKANPNGGPQMQQLNKIPLVGGAPPPPGGANPGGQTSSAATYTVLEAETGKILLAASTDSTQIANTVTNNNRPITTEEQNALIVKIMQRNTPGGIDMDSTALIDTAKANLYFFSKTKQPLFQQAAANFLSTGSQIQPGPTVGGANPLQLNATGIIEGVAQFLVNRVNTEFQDNFVDLLIDYLENKHPELGVLFPKTLESLKNFKIAQYKSSFTAIQNACQADIGSLVGHMSGLTAFKWCQKLMNKYPPLVTLFTACDIVDNLHQNLNLQEIIYRAGIAPYLNFDASGQYSSAIRLVALISNSIRDIQFRTTNKDKQGWIDADRINGLAKSPELYQVFLGLLAQNSIGIKFNLGAKAGVFNFYQEMMNAEATLVKDQSLVYSLSQQVASSAAVISSFTTILATKPQLPDYLSAFGDVATYLVNLSQTGIDLFPSSPTTEKIGGVLKEIKGTYLPLFNDLDSIAYNVAQKQYATALNQGVKLFDTLLVDFPAAGGDAADSNAAKTDPPDHSASDSVKTFISFMSNLGQFIGAVAEAQSSKDVSDALDAFALPPGSSRAIKENGWTLGLNAYVNLYYCWNKQYPNANIPSTESGISAPIGLALSRGICYGKGGAISLFAGIVDIGAIFTYEAANSSSTAPIKSTIQFGQILSPSISLIYDLPLFGKKGTNIPIEIGGGVQWGPRLQNVTSEGNSVLPSLTVRGNIFIGFDLPVLHILGNKRSH